MSHTAEVIDLYLYDTEVSDEMFRRLLYDAIDRDAGNPELRRALATLRDLQGSEATDELLAGYSKKV